MSIPATIANAVQTTQQWLNELCETGDLSDTGEAVAVLRSVLHQLRDRLSLDELTSRHFPNSVPAERAVRDVFALLAL